jgi:hypothetical protein
VEITDRVLGVPAVEASRMTGISSGRFSDCRTLKYRTSSVMEGGPFEQ